MSTDHALSPPSPTTYAGPATPSVLAVAVAAGVVLGVVDLWWSTYHPSAWSSVANSCAGWAACAFALGAALRVDALRAAVAAVVMLAVAVEAYYAAEVLLQLSDRTILTSPVAMEWLVLAGVAGAVYGSYGQTPSEARVLVVLALGMLALSLRRPWVAVAALVLSLPLSLAVAAAFTASGVYM